MSLFLSGRARRRLRRGSPPLIVMPRGTVALGARLPENPGAYERLGEELARVSKALADAKPLRCDRCGDHGDWSDRDFILIDGLPVCGNCRDGETTRGRGRDSHRNPETVARRLVDDPRGPASFVTASDVEASGSRWLLNDVLGGRSNF